MIVKLKVKSAKRKIKTQNLKLLTLSFGFTLLVLRFTLAASFAQPVSSTELINNAKQYDGKIVVYEGEVIGDIMKRKDNAWVNINDGSNAIGIWMSDSLAKTITYTGSYKSKGDVIEITGVFNRACPEHGGDLDIHAQTIRKTGSGRVILEKLNIGKINWTVILLGVLGIAWISRLLAGK